MFKYFPFVFLLCVARLFAHVATTENDPSALVEGIVSSITGDLYALEEDVVIAGAEPLRLRRSYISSEGVWDRFDHHFYAELLPGAGILNVGESNGTMLIYYCDAKVKSHLDIRRRGPYSERKYLLKEEG